MITLDLVTAINGFLLLSLMIFFSAWFAGYRRRNIRNQDLQSSAYLKQCPYCGQVFMDYQQQPIVECTICGSYIEEQRGGAHAKE